MSNGTIEPTSSENASDYLMSKTSLTLIAGVLSLGAYWGWIFTIYSSAALNPFGSAGITTYCLLNVLAAGLSALCMFAISFCSFKAEKLFSGIQGAVILGTCSCVGCIPALLYQFGINVSFVMAAVPWGISACASSIVFLNTGRFFIWLKREKLSRCIALSFFLAAVFYALPQLLAPVPSVLAIMILPILSCFCTVLASKIPDRDYKKAESDNAIVSIPYKTRLAEHAGFIPLTLIYTISFGSVSYLVLYLAVSSNLIFILVASIFIASLFLMLCSFVLKVKIENELFRRFLLALVAVALLPFPYLPILFRVIFLSFAVFGFTCFDAIGWGDIADEVRNRQLHLFEYASTATSINFLGIFAGWGIGAILYATCGIEHFDIGFGILAVVLLMVLIIYLTFSSDGHSSEKGVEIPPQYKNEWQNKCSAIAETNQLTKQEERVLTLLARGRSYSYIARELVISVHTVKTHIYHIYQKLGIHSQQELIDLFEDNTL